MIINSLDFLSFFILFFFSYYFLNFKSIKIQNIILFLGSISFYAFADVKMLILVISIAVIFFGLGFLIKNAKTQKSSFLFLSLGVIIALGILFYFKYLNFFCQSVNDLFLMLGLGSNWKALNILMPLGVSFWIFRLISYLIEIHRGKIQPEKNLLAFVNYVIFFPCILSGPIDRPNLFLPQIKSLRKIDSENFTYGIYRIILGLFKKMVIANRLTVYTDAVYSNPNSSGLSLILASVLYAFEIYCDFSGYSDMAIGVARLMKIKVAENFNLPFFSTSIAKYWRNWHISLTSWLTDYVFMPLNIYFRDYGKLGLFGAILINIVLVGCWHGANWTFLVFGIYHSILFLPLIITGSFGKKQKDKFNKFGLISFKDTCKMLYTFLLVVIGLIIFRASSMTEAGDIMYRIITDTQISVASIQYAILPFTGDNTCLAPFLTVSFFITALMFYEFLQFIRKDNFLKRIDFFWQIFLLLSILLFSTTNSNSFIYFQF